MTLADYCLILHISMNEDFEHFTIELQMEQYTYSKVYKQVDGSQISRKSCIVLIIFTFATLCMFIAGVVLLAKQAGREAAVTEKKVSTTIIDLDDFW